MKQRGLILMAMILLTGCGEQVQEVLDKNPEYAGKPDQYAAALPERDKVLRRRVLVGQTDR